MFGTTEERQKLADVFRRAGAAVEGGSDRPIIFSMAEVGGLAAIEENAHIDMSPNDMAKAVENGNTEGKMMMLRVKFMQIVDKKTFEEGCDILEKEMTARVIAAAAPRP